MKTFTSLVLVIFSTLHILAQTASFPEATMHRIEQSIQLPKIPNYRIELQTLGAKGDSISDNKPFFDQAMALCKQHQGGTIVVPAGIFTLNGPIHFTSNVRLELSKGAKIRFSDNPIYYPNVLTSWEGTLLYNYSPLIYAINCTNIAITGEGIIDGEGSQRWNSFKAQENADKMLSREMNHKNIPLEKRQFGQGHFLRPQLIQFFRCKNILVENIRIEDSPFWCLHLLQSQSITVRGISYHAHNKNNDGIDPEYSKNILIEKVTFDNGDDNIAVKSGRDHEGRSNATMPSHNIIIRNCQFKGLHALVLGSEMSAGVHDVFVENCKAWGYLKRGIYFKTNADRGGYIKQIYARNIAFKEVEDCLFVTSNYMSEGSNFPSAISDAYFTNISCEKANDNGIVVQGFPTKKVKNLYFSNINIQTAKNPLTITNSENVFMNEINIGPKAVAPSFVK